MKECRGPSAEPATVEAPIHASYLVFPDRDFRVKEVVLDGTVTAENTRQRDGVRTNTRVTPVQCDGYLQSTSPPLV